MGHTIPLLISSLNGHTTVLSGHDFSCCSTVSKLSFAWHPKTWNLQKCGKMLAIWPASVLVLYINEPRHMGQNLTEGLQLWHIICPWEQLWMGSLRGRRKQTGHWRSSAICSCNSVIVNNVVTKTFWKYKQVKDFQNICESQIGIIELYQITRKDFFSLCLGFRTYLSSKIVQWLFIDLKVFILSYQLFNPSGLISRRS